MCQKKQPVNRLVRAEADELCLLDIMTSHKGRTTRVETTKRTPRCGHSSYRETVPFWRSSMMIALKPLGVFGNWRSEPAG
jgi:hypothetical protein